MKINNLIVNDCNNCPFFHTDYNDFSMGHSTTDTCNLAYFYNFRNMNKQQYIISSHDNMGPNDNPIPNWCPLKNEELSIKLEEFSGKQLEEIHSIKEQLSLCDQMIDNLDTSVENDMLMYEQLEKRIENLYTKLEKFYENNN
jgi:hypothetical protein